MEQITIAPTEGTRIAWRWKSERQSQFFEGWVSDKRKELIRVSDWKYGEGSWLWLKEIDWHSIDDR